MLGEVVGKSMLWLVGALMLFGAALQMPFLAGKFETPGAHQVSTGSRGAARNEDRSRRERPAGHVVELQAGRNGHVVTDADINGRSVEVMVDTGASMVALTFEAAERAGIYVRDRDFTLRASTANGVSLFAPVTLSSVSIGDITVRNVRAAVAERGKLQTTLLGMSFLGRLERFELRNGRLILEK